MFFEKSWLTDADNATSIGTGWNLTASAGNYLQVSSGAVRPSSTDTILGRRIFSAAVPGELYAEVTISAANSSSEIYVGFASGNSDTDLASAALYARYNGSNSRFQIMRKTSASSSLTAVGSSFTQTVTAGDVMRLTLHGTTATLTLNGSTVVTSSVASNPDVSSYAYPALRFRNSNASRVTRFKAADYGVEIDPGGSDIASTVTGGEFYVYDEAQNKMVLLSYLGRQEDGVPTQRDITLEATPAIIYPSDEGYGPDPTMANAPILPVTFAPIRTINVSNATQLQSALLDAQAGDLIELAPGIYNDKFEVINKQGTAEFPIVIRGPKEAVLRLGTVNGSNTVTDFGSGYVFALDQASYVWCVGFTVEVGPKGIMADETTHCWLKGLTVHRVEQEAVHFRNFSNYNLIEDCTVYDTGLDSPGFGEAFYVGTANSNLSSPQSRTGGNPDICVDNVFRRCYAYQFTAEGVDIKEGSTGTIVEYCYFDGSLLDDHNSADTWVDVKGNSSIIRYNYGRTTYNGAYSVYDPVPGTSGRNNVFRGNVGDTRKADGNKSPDVAINIKVAGAGNIVYSDNKFVGSVGAMTNIVVTPAP